MTELRERTSATINPQLWTARWNVVCVACPTIGDRHQLRSSDARMLEAAAGSLHSAVRTCVLPIRHTCQHQRLVLAPAPQMEQRPLCMQLGCGGECGGAAV